MKLLCISASNVIHKKHDSASTKICELAGQIAATVSPDVQTEILRLADADLTNCIFCGKCKETGNCVYDEGFNAIYDRIKANDRVLWVVPFYSVIPSKVSMITEKLNQIFYTGWLHKPDQPNSLHGKRMALIGHCGSDLQANPQLVPPYRDILLKPLYYSLMSLGFNVVGVDDTDDIKGILLGVQGYTERDDAIFPDAVHNWPEMGRTISPLVEELVK